MLGAREVVEAMADRLEAHLGAEVTRLDRELGTATAGTLGGGPEVGTYDAQPRLITTTPQPAVEVDVSLYPFVQLVPLRTLGPVQVVDQDHEGRTIRQRWALQAAVWANGDGYEQVAAVRDRLTLAVVELLLRRPAWQAERGAFDVVVRDLAVEVANAGRDDVLESYVSASRITFPVDVDSLLAPARSDHGPASSVTTDTRGTPWTNPGLL